MLRPRQPLRPPRIRSSRTIYRPGSHDHRSGVPTSLATIPPSQAKTDGISVGESVAKLLIAERSGDGFREPVTYTPPSPPIPGVWLPTAPTPPIGTVPRADAAVQPRLGRPVPARRPAGAGEQEVGAGLQRGEGDRIEHDTAHVAKRRPNARGTLLGGGAGAAGTWLVPQVRRRSPVGHPRCVPLHGDDLGDLCRCAHRVLRREVPLRVLEADHCGSRRSHGRQRRDRRRSRLEPAAPGDTEPPEYPSAHSCVTPTGGIVIAKFLGTPEIDFTIPSLTGLGDRHFARAEDLEYEVANARIWGGIHFRSAVEDGVEIGKKTAHQVLAHHFQRSND